MKLGQTLLIVLLVLLGVRLADHYWPRDNVSVAASKETAFERIKRTGVLRCGYLSWPPYLEKDANTGEVKGAMADFMNAIADKLSLKIEWALEMGMADIGPALKTEKIDAFCQIAGIVGARAREMDYSIPYAYLAIYAVGRAGDPKVLNAKSLADLNSQNYAATYMDGEIAHIITRTHLPNARTVAMQSLSSTADIFDNIATGKADVSFFDKRSFDGYNASNPGKVQLYPIPPAGIFAIGLPVSQAEPQLRQMLSHALTDIVNSGMVDGIFNKYGIGPDEMLRMTLPYQLPTAQPH